MDFTNYDASTLLDYLPEAVLLEDLEGNILDCNSRACELLGYDREELFQLEFDDLVPDKAPAFPPAKIDKETESGGSIETINARKNGTKIPVKLKGRIIETHESRKFIVMLTEEKQNNEFGLDLEDYLTSSLPGLLSFDPSESASLQLQEVMEWQEALFEGSRDGILISNPNGCFVAVNRAACELTGYSREELLDMRIPDLHEEPDLQAFRKYHERILDGEEVLSTAKILRKDGEKIAVEFNNSRILIDGTAYMHTTARNITKRKEAKEALSEERDKLRKLHDAVDQLQQQETEKEIAQTAVNIAEKMLDFETCDVSLVEGNYLVPKANSAVADIDEATSFKIGEGIAGKTAEEGETIWGKDVRNHSNAKPADSDYRSFISLPIGELGVLQVISTQVASFNERDVELAEILANHIREELKRVRLEKELREQAIRDPLTDLFNRRYFNEIKQKEIEKAQRYDNSIAFLMIDINRFKEINDRYSHQTGDKVLKEIADLLRSNVREADTVVRYGGDEFLVMMPATDGGVTAIISRLKDELVEWNDQTNLIDFPLTLAMGIAHWSADQDRNVEKALKEADRKMYQDKGK